MEHMVTFPLRLVTFPGYVFLSTGDDTGIRLALSYDTKVGIDEIHRQRSGGQAQQDQASFNALFGDHTLRSALLYSFLAPNQNPHRTSLANCSLQSTNWFSIMVLVKLSLPQIELVQATKPA